MLPLTTSFVGAILLIAQQMQYYRSARFTRLALLATSSSGLVRLAFAPPSWKLPSPSMVVAPVPKLFVLLTCKVGKFGALVVTLSKRIALAP